MADYQITCWRDLPSLVVAKDGEEISKSPLAPRFQEAIDEAAMRLGDVGSDAYLAGWRRSEWTGADGTPAAVAETVVARLEQEWTQQAVTAFLDSLVPGTEQTP